MATNSDGWGCFEDDDDEEELTSVNESSELLHQAYLQIFTLLGSTKKETHHGSFRNEEVELQPHIAIIEDNASGQTAIATETSSFIEKLTQSKYIVLRGNNGLSENTDCVADLRVRKQGQPLDQPQKTQFRYLRPGGLAMFIIQLDADQHSLESSSIANSMMNKSLWLTESAKFSLVTTDSKGILLVRRRGVLLNESAVLWKPSLPKMLAAEREVAEEITICRSCSSIAAGTLSHGDILRGKAALEKHGVCVIPRMFDKEYVKAWGEVAISDLEHASRILEKQRTEKEEDEESVFGGEGLSNNYHELAMREAHRVDLRHGPRMISHAARITQEVEALALNNQHSKNIPFARHSGLMKLFQAVMNPHPVESVDDIVVESDEEVPRPHSSGNFGRWNFEGSAPTTEIPLNVTAVGAVMSMPRCADQAVHADTYHLFENTHLPPHYLNFFLPSMDDITHCVDHEASGSPSSSAVGQTAFIVGSHRMADCARIMQEGSDSALQEKMTRLLRPHVSPGDAIIFDTRVLHIGLANDSHRKEYPGIGFKGIVRPVLYANVTQRWFEDKKNWEKKMLFTPEDRAEIETKELS